jgi:hypothetical protein
MSKASDDPMISATEAMKLMEEHLHQPLNLSKVLRLMASGEIPSEKSLLDKRQRLARRSAVMAWIEKAKKQEGRPALVLAYQGG